MAKMGFSAFDAQGNMKSMATIVSELNQKTKGYTQQQKNAALATIFGQEALSGMLALVDAGPDQLKSLTKAMEQSDGASKKMAETQTNNLYGALESVKGAWETMQINLGEKSAPALTAGLKTVAEYMPTVGDAIMTGLDTGISWIGSVAKPVIDGLVSFISDKMPQIKRIVENLANAVVGYWNNFLKPTWEAWKPMLSVVAEHVGNSIGFILDVLEGLTEFLAGVFTLDSKKAMDGIGKIFTGTFDVVKKNIQDAINLLKSIPKAASGLFDIAKGNVSKFLGFGAPKNANGTGYFSGGLSQVNERGGEMQVLRNGTSVIPADRTKQMLEGKSNNNVSQTIQIVLDGKVLSNTVVNNIVPELKLRLANI